MSTVQRKKPAAKKTTKKANPKAAPTVQKTYPAEGLATVPEAAEFLRCGRNTIYRMIDAKELKHILIRSLVRIPWPALHNLVAGKSNGEQERSA